MAEAGRATAMVMVVLLWLEGAGVGANWCVARSDASDHALQTALDYACGAGADCVPLQSNGLCYLPNTLQAHASYAFNSYFQRKAMAPGSCDFSGTAIVAKTDPSYGSCVYPSSLSTAGGATTTPTTTGGYNPSTTPVTPTSTTPLSGDGSGGLSNPGSAPLMPTSDSSCANSLMEYRACLAGLMVHTLVGLAFKLQAVLMV